MLVWYFVLDSGSHTHSSGIESQTQYSYKQAIKTKSGPETQLKFPSVPFPEYGPFWLTVAALCPSSTHVLHTAAPHSPLGKKDFLKHHNFCPRCSNFEERGKLQNCYSTHQVKGVTLKKQSVHMNADSQAFIFSSRISTCKGLTLLGVVWTWAQV